ncbi:MAG: complex I NDUFA9 subunit family protein [Gammaproteobacteria bacterium]|nr:MAG: complex I NDUFA9 subunit family protein [Gammaproteobacteria bacterium]
MTINTITVLGGSGFVGTHIISQLCPLNKRIRVLTRRRDKCRHLLVLPNVTVIETDIHDQHELDKALRNTDAVINLVGILNEKGSAGEGFRWVHFELTRKILNACHTNKVRRIVHMSALNADANSGSSHYLRSKGEAENHLHAFAGKIQVTSFRPSVIFGPDDSFFNRFAGLLKLSPGVFPLACGDARFAPVYVEDVARNFVDALEDKNTFGKRIDLCGPRQYTLKQLVEYTAQVLGLKRRVINLPDFAARLQAHLLEWFPGKPFSVDNYNSLKTDSICKQGIPQPTSIESVVPYYLGNQQYRLRQNQQRRQAKR